MGIELPSTESYDVLILGGGPAGTATALSLHRLDPALRVAVVERSDYSTLRVGESLPPPAQALLRKLGVWESFLNRSPLQSSGTRAAWGSPVFHENEFIYSTFGRGWHLDRRDFDAMLAEEAERAGVIVYRESTASIVEKEASLWCVQLQRGGQSTRQTLRTRFIVDATGRHGAFARTQGARTEVFDHLVAVVMFLRFAEAHRVIDTYTSVEACEYGWWYGAALPNGDMAAIFMTDAKELARLEWRTPEQWWALTSFAPLIAARLKLGVPLDVPKVHSAASQRLHRSTGDGWLAVGDAACTWDPLSSQGIMKSLQSGIDASAAISRHLRGDGSAIAVYERLIASSYNRYLDSRSAYYTQEQRWPNSPFWKNRHEVINLHPGQYLCRQNNAGQSERWSVATRLEGKELEALADACREPRPAHQVLTAFQKSHSQVRSDRDVLLALQALIENGILTAV